MGKQYDLQCVIKAVEWLVFDGKVKNRRELAEKLNYTESSFSQIMNGKVKISDRFVKKLLNFDPRFNPEWFVSNTTQMLQISQNSFGQMTNEEVEDVATSTISEELVKLFKAGEIYSADVHNRLMAEKDKRIEELQREVWMLQKQVDELLK